MWVKFGPQVLLEPNYFGVKVFSGIEFFGHNIFLSFHTQCLDPIFLDPKFDPKID